ncbi:glycosyltransferase family 2 protein [Murimonas intestini]|uniref:glycosyltransferase family 2 protein n=1 Tax=Murimonas intestini TaxID=1337051 RepID=UPI00214C18CC|nr:glycosyltransferase [Murimonas intestini]MCR1882442.1 glycosyltransferase [Murimonas intestini]
MSQQYLITVIVPIYNAEKQLERCVHSIIEQSYSELEILLINDGSTDNSLLICEKLSILDDRIRIINQVNSGVSVARNSGMAVAQGIFYCFVDADDWIECTYIADMVNALQNYDCVISGYTRQYKETYQESTPSGMIIDLENINNNEVRKLFVEGFIHPCWNKLFKASIIKKHDIKFRTDIHISEDSYFKYSSIILVIENSGYHYCLFGDDISLSKKVYPDLFDIYGEVYLALEDLLKRGNCGQILAQKILVGTIFPQVYSSIKKIVNNKQCSREYRKRILKEINELPYCQYVICNADQIAENMVEKLTIKLIKKRYYVLLEALWKMI